MQRNSPYVLYQSVRPDRLSLPVKAAENTSRDHHYQLDHNALHPMLLSAGLSKAEPCRNATCGAIEVKTPEIGTTMVPMEGGAEKEYFQWLPVQSDETGMH